MRGGTEGSVRLLAKLFGCRLTPLPLYLQDSSVVAKRVPTVGVWPGILSSRSTPVVGSFQLHLYPRPQRRGLPTIHRNRGAVYPREV